MKAPCKDCPDRKVTKDYNCHTTGEKYLAFRAYREALNADKAKKYATERKMRRYF